MLHFKNLVAKGLNITLSQFTGIANSRKRQTGRVSVPTKCTTLGETDPNSKPKSLYLCEQCAMTTTLNFDR